MCYRRISQICRLPSRVCAALVLFGRVPNPVSSDEERQRFWHIDIPSTPPAERRRELAALKQFVAISEKPEEWFFERIRQLELAGRHGN